MLWKQIKSCWKQEPKERPTTSNILEVLLPLSEVYQRKSVTSVGEQDDDAVIGEWGLAPSLEGEDLVWFVDYLEGVSFSTVSPCSSLSTGVYPLWYL